MEQLSLKWLSCLSTIVNVNRNQMRLKYYVYFDAHSDGMKLKLRQNSFHLQPEFRIIATFLFSSVVVFT